MNGFRKNTRPDVPITRNEWDRIGRQNMITDEICRALGVNQRLDETSGDTRVAQTSMNEGHRKSAGVCL